MAVRGRPYKYPCHRKEEDESQKFYSLLSLVIKIKVVQNVNRISETSIPVSQYPRIKERTAARKVGKPGITGNIRITGITHSITVSHTVSQ